MAKVKPYLITILTGIGISVIVFIYERPMFGTSLKMVLHSICDGFFVSGILIAGYGLLAVVANAGNFHGLTYLGKLMVTKLRHKVGEEELTRSYYDYVKSKEEKKRSVKFLMLVGIGYLVLSIVVLVLYQQI